MFSKRGLENNKGQVTIFIIVAILVIGIAVLLYFLFPGLTSEAETEAQSPNEYIDNCIGDKVGDTVGVVSSQGGFFNPSEAESYNHLGDRVKYLCYINQDYAPCVIQEPLLLQSMTNEIEEEISEDVNSCFRSMVESYSERGYEASLLNSETESNVDIIPGRVLVSFDNELTLSREETQRYETFQVVLDSKLYEFSGIVMSILDWEQEYGSAPISNYMTFYPELLIQEDEKYDGTKIYIIEDVDSGEEFKFAVRSVVIPAGY